MSFRILIALAFLGELTAQTAPQMDPQRQLWASIKRVLVTPDGDEYFQSSMKDAMLPRLRGTLISVVPGDTGNILVLGLTDSTSPEVALLFQDLPSELAPGATVEFEGVPFSFTRDPFLVAFRTEHVTKPFGALAPSWYFGPAAGAIKNGRYRNNHTRVAFDLPSGWTLEGTHPSGESGDVAILIHSGFAGAYAAVWMSRKNKNTHEIPEAPPIIPETRDPASNRSESRTWIVTGNTRVLFLAVSPTLEFEEFHTQFDRIVSSSVVP